MATGSNQPLIEAVVSAPPTLVVGDGKSVVSSPSATGGGCDLLVECPFSGAQLESNGPPHSKPVVFQTIKNADHADDPGVAGCESGVIPRVNVHAVTSWDQAGLDFGLGPKLPVTPSKCDSENAENLVDAVTDLVAGLPRITSCPTKLQQLVMDAPPFPIADTIETLNCECRGNGYTTGAELPELLASKTPAPPGPESQDPLAPNACSPSAGIGIQMRVSEGFGCLDGPIDVQLDPSSRFDVLSCCEMIGWLFRSSRE
ncbi:hypothetical protein Nepgr_024738 [Nepenthes gracilis]|uniref:Uncharacterized protein n=1 Tax=Nepenthes gracilis TaxID=150966 RepID=A0AAD3T3T9_NEPGR|nr:hypothetical protein Nepgr_024738 [Nepenthes gracilis]